MHVQIRCDAQIEFIIKFCAKPYQIHNPLNCDIYWALLSLAQGQQ